MQYTTQLHHAHLLRLHAFEHFLENPQKPTGDSGLLIPTYCDHRLIPSDVEARTCAIEGMQAIIAEKNLSVDVVAGVATAGISFGAILAAYLRKPFLYVRSETKGYGKGKLIEGIVYAGANVLVIEDVVFRDSDMNVLGILTLYNYELHVTKAESESREIDIFSLTTFLALIAYLYEQGSITQSQMKELQLWQKDPWKWRK
jgi:orotate phosphoribosyltransferase